MSVSWTERKRLTTYTFIKATGLFIAILCFISCSSTEKKTVAQITELDYATQLQITESTITVQEAWPGASPKQYNIPNKTPERIICTSTSHLYCLELLGLENKLVGFPNVKYISSSKIREQVEKGEVSDVGKDGNLNLELIIGLQPDLVIGFDAIGNSDDLQRISAAGIPVILNADFMETSALGKAEWIKFFGVLVGESTLADSIFGQIEQDYQALQALTKNVANRPTILSGNVYGDTWFLPGGQNNMAKFFEDAGGSYTWSEDSTTSWLELSFESVFEKAREADLWIGMGSFSSLEEIATQDARYIDFTAYQKGKAFNYNNRQIPDGGNDFFESGYMRPDLVLADLIHIIHPELLPDHELYYFRKLP
ncbi:MAG: ABC transporter substrate-binding protein [Cytophagales bacterium]|nr:ABC transporter substrate-binding protein [Cytophagales bacterium]